VSSEGRAATAVTEAPASTVADTHWDSIVHRFLEQAAQRTHRPALRFTDGDSWRTMTWGEYRDAVMQTASGLIDIGVDAGDRVAIVSANRPEWHVADLGVLAAGAVSVPVYPTSSSSQVAHVLSDSGTRVCVVDGAEQLAKIVLHLDALPALERIVVVGGGSGFDRPGLVMTFDDLRSRGAVDAAHARLSQLRPDDLATLVYTSGTTGTPKGTCITHGNITWTIDAVQSMIRLDADDRWLSYLPLSHIAERMTSHFGQIAAGGETWFARNLATVPDDLRACRPTIFMAVPRVWQKLHVSIHEQLDATPLRMSRLLDRLADGRSHIGSVDAWTDDRWWDGPTMSAIDQTLGRLVRHRLGLDRARLLVSAAAPIHTDLLRWFHGIGLPIAEVYGQTEDCGPATINPPEAIRIGSVGIALPGLEVDVADDGELRFRGGSVCAGYFGRPDATAELIDDDGWMSTGDLGHVDDDGYVWITGRKKDLIINAAGKNIAPSAIEARLSMEPLIGQAVVIGDGRKYLTAVMTLDPDAAAEWARHHGTFNDLAALTVDPRLRSAMQESVDNVNREHAPVEQIKYWRLIADQLTVERGELTPTMKVRRDVVRDKYADLIETMYANP
jgi:long-chain acyl-CoA synthetase